MYFKLNKAEIWDWVGKENNMEKKEKGNFNTFILLIFILVIIRHGMNIITQFLKLFTPETVEYNGQILEMANHTVAAYNIVLSIIAIASLILVLCKKIAGAYIFLALQIVNCIILSFVMDGDVFVNIFATLVMCGIFVGALYLRKDGKSGWEVLRNKQSLEE